MNYKSTLLMPKTDFEMRGKLPTKEPAYVERWQNANMYEKVIKQNEGKEHFIFHDGPPYANGNMHVGHALNKTLKDIVVRYKSMNGFYAPLIHGWDTHGMPIEIALQKKGFSIKNLSVSEFCDKCSKFADEQVGIQREQIRRMGVLGNMDEPYLTKNKDFVAKQIDVFAQMALKGFIYKGLKTVFWSPSSQTALAEAEIEYYDVKSYSIYVAFDVMDGKGLIDNDSKFIIWTTTPWTIPSNLAICLNKSIHYGLFSTNKGKFVVSINLMESLKNELGFEEVVLLKEFKGSELEGIVTKHPLYDRPSLIILGDHVTEESGTGCVHTAPGHGEDDFIVGCQYHLPPYCPVDEKGYYTKEVGEDLAFKFYEEGNEIVIDKLTKCHALLKVSQFVHSYPHDWRTKKPLIYRATPQWFASIDKIRDTLLEEIKNVTWYPSWGELRMHNMIKDRADWCISRQRSWGVPIPVIYNEDNTPILEKEVFDHIVTLFYEKGPNVWHDLTALELLPKNYSNPASPNKNFKKETDIMDVWFDSGSSSISVFEKESHPYPADLYFEGFDQYRGWFNSSLIIGTAINGHAPYKAVVSHGFILDGEGRKMSKSLKNTLDPNVLVQKYGADILRLWVASSNYQEDIRISENIIQQAAEMYKNIRNKFKFMLGNLADFNPKQDMVDEYTLIDNAILALLYKCIDTCMDAYDHYQFNTVLSTIINYLTIHLSGFYLDMAKDILYCDQKDGLRRRQVQSVIYQVVKELVKLLAPIIPHTAEEIYSHFVGKEKESIHLEKYHYHPFNVDQDERLSSYLHQYDVIYKVRNDVLKALEEKRSEKVIGSSLDAYVTIGVKNEEIYKLLSSFDQKTLNQIFIVSFVELVKENVNFKTYDTVSVSVKAHEGVKCERCWNKVDADKIKEGNLCPRCHSVLHG